jgi:hypothetical protein
MLVEVQTGFGRTGKWFAFQHTEVMPDVMTLADLVRLAGRLSGHPRVVLPLPAPLARLQAAVMEWLPGEPLMSRDNVDSMQVPNVAGGVLPGLASLDIAASAVETVAAGYLGGASGPGRFERWRARRGLGSEVRPLFPGASPAQGAAPAGPGFVRRDQVVHR